MSKVDKNRDNRPIEPDPSSLVNLPVTPQAVEEYFAKYRDVDLFRLRKETMLRIEKITGNPLLCYITQVSFLPSNIPLELVSIENGDIEGFDALIDTIHRETTTRKVDVMLVSNGGSPEAAERIVKLLRENFEQLRFVLPANAYSAATMMSFACDSILMTDTATLGPIDPQVNGIPARSILRGIEDLEKRLKEEGPEALAAYVHLLNGYSLHLLEICKSAEELSKELARDWLSEYMLKCDPMDPQVEKIVAYFVNFDLHKSHSRSIGYKQAASLNLKVEKLERGNALSDLVRSLYSQYTIFLRVTPFFKVFENAYGTAWGRQSQPIPINQKAP